MFSKFAKLLGKSSSSQNEILTKARLELANEDLNAQMALAEAQLDQAQRIRGLDDAHSQGASEEQNATPKQTFGRLPENEIANFQRARDIVFNNEENCLLEARKELTRLYLEGHGEAFSVLGYMAVVYAGDESDVSDGLKILHKCSDAGDAGSTCLLGNIYEQGLTLSHNFPKAWTYYSKAIEQGSVAALTNKGTMAIEGIGVPKDIELGISLLKQAQEKGSIKAGELLLHFEGKHHL